MSMHRSMRRLSNLSSERGAAGGRTSGCWPSTCGSLLSGAFMRADYLTSTSLSCKKEYLSTESLTNRASTGPKLAFQEPNGRS